MASKMSSSPPICEYLLVVLCALVVRWCISLGGYSGANKPPMYGDYEAQRHWMEITYQLPIKEWYHNTTNNDLMYWGLDYPPLTAYHSWILGAISHHINPNWVALHSSRGIENPVHKLFMRYSVVASDLLVYIPAVCLFMYFSSRPDNKKALLSSLSVLMYPGLILIDHGHFQYNCVSLGLALWGIMGLSRGKDVLGSMAFVLALCYKQMELYHAWPFLCYLLGKCIFIKKENGFLKLIKLGVTVIGTLAVCFSPFLKEKESALQVLQRLFPFERGLYEDKVANVWCTLSIFVKLKEILSLQTLVFLCLSSTLVGLLPCGLNLLSRPSFARFKLALANSSLVFFLLSFQVHEKSILLAALPVCLLLPDYPFISFWFLQISTFSMFPLLVKDGLALQYFSTQLLFTILVSLSYGLTPNVSSKTKVMSWVNTLLPYMMYLSMVGCLVFSVASLVLSPPQGKPDLFPVLISVYSCGHLVLFTVYLHYLQFTLDRSGASHTSSHASAKTTNATGKITKITNTPPKKGNKPRRRSTNTPESETKVKRQ